MTKGKAFTGIAAILFAIYLGAAPYITVYQMKSAAESQDGEALSEYIEFPSVRQSLKDQMNVFFMKKMEPELKDNPFAALGVAFSGLFVDRMVDTFVSPAGLTQLMSGQKPQPADEEAGGKNKAETKDSPKPFSNASMGYESLSKFVVSVKEDSGKEGKFILRRRGIGWRLTEIVIPFE